MDNQRALLMKFSKEQIEDTIINGNIIDTKTKQEIIISEYEKSQKNIQPTGFDPYEHQMNIAKKVMTEDSASLRNLSK